MQPLRLSCSYYDLELGQEEDLVNVSGAFPSSYRSHEPGLFPIGPVAN
jgi:hypothetical protein